MFWKSFFFIRSYKLSDTHEVNQTVQKKVLDDGHQVLVIRGSYTFIDNDGIKHIVQYIADENGFRSQIDGK